LSKAALKPLAVNNELINCSTMKHLALLFLCIYISIAGSAQFVSPYTLSKPVDQPVCLSTMVVFGSAYFIGASWNLPPEASIAPLHRSDVNVFDRSATYQHSKTAGTVSDVCLYSSIGLPLLHLISKNSRKDFVKITAINAEVLVMDLAVTELFKETVRRKRPLLYDPSVPLDSKYTKDNFQSFFSGHTSTVAAMSFCFATMFMQYHPHSKAMPAVWALCAVLPLATGTLRYAAGKHYWTDIIAGYAVGALIGVGVPYLHSVKRKFNHKKL
jgi:membrane-associated phospholipid phosphatase